MTVNVNVKLMGGIGDRVTAQRIARELQPHLARIVTIG